MFKNVVCCALLLAVAGCSQSPEELAKERFDEEIASSIKAFEDMQAWECVKAEVEEFDISRSDSISHPFKAKVLFDTTRTSKFFSSYLPEEKFITDAHVDIKTAVELAYDGESWKRTKVSTMVTGIRLLSDKPLPLEVTREAVHTTTKRFQEVDPETFPWNYLANGHLAGPVYDFQEIYNRRTGENLTYWTAED